MPTVVIPSPMRDLTGNNESIYVEGKSIRQVINALEKMHPGIRSRLVEDDEIRPNIAVAVDGEVSSLGMLQKVGDDSEIHFLAAISGG
jgi:molybdopterin synthase sulfur carrier subunit